MARKKTNQPAPKKVFAIPADIRALGSAYTRFIVPSMQSEHANRIANAAKRPPKKASPKKV